MASLLLSGVLYPLLVRLWREDRQEFGRLSRQSAKTLAAASLPIMAFLAMEADRLLPLIFGPAYRADAWVAAWLVPTVLIAFLHNLAAYMMLSFGRERLLLVFYTGGLALGLAVCALIIPGAPLWGAAVAIVVTKGAVAACTIGYCQRRTGLMNLASAVTALCVAALALALWWGVGRVAPREAAEAAALVPLLWLLWRWRPAGRPAPPAARSPG